MPRLSFFLLSLFLISCSEKKNDLPPLEKPPFTNAPEINSEFGWLNTDRAYSIKDFRGKIVLLDFWTFGCINCQHIIPDLEKLEREFESDLIIIGVHSAKFSSERSLEAIKKAILKFDIGHPVVNDADFKVWKAYTVRAWPTLVLIDPDGKVVGMKAGEGFYQTIRENIVRLKELHKDKISEGEFRFKKEEMDKTLLRFPSKVIEAQDGTAWVADSGNNRIVRINSNGGILETIGSGKKGKEDGTFEASSFNEPHGIALKGNELYIADTKNNLIRKADLIAKTLVTIAGDGKLDYYKPDQKWEGPVRPNSPWDLLIHGKVMYVANAGNHQILRMTLGTNTLMRFAGSGAEALKDGSLKEAAFNQPSGLALIDNTLYIADAEASAVRSIDLKKGAVKTVIGKGLFKFGDVDGGFEEALVQHAVGIFAHEGNLFLADTYNGKIKEIDPETETIKTIKEGLNEPNDLIIIGNELWISDTNNHKIIIEKK